MNPTDQFITDFLRRMREDGPVDDVVALTRAFLAEADGQPAEELAAGFKRLLTEMVEEVA